MSLENFQLSTQASSLRITTRYDNRYRYDVDVSTYKLDNLTKYKLNGGYAVEIFHEIVQLYGFGYEIVPEVNTYEFSKASEYNIDLYVGSFGLRDRKLGKAAFPTFVTGFSKVAAFINHSFEDNEHDIIMTSFDWNLIVSVFIMLSLFATAFSILGRFENFTISESIFHSIAVFVNKNSNLQFEKSGTRFSLWTTCLSVSIIWAYYSAVVCSTLTVVRYSVNSFESLLESQYALLMEYGYSNNGSSLHHIAKALGHIKVMSHFLSNAKMSGFVFESLENAILKVKNTQSAYVIDEETGMSAIKNTIGYFPCKWDKISIYGIKYPWCMYLGNSTPHKAAINMGILKLSQYGILKRIHRKWIPSSVGCQKDSAPPDIGLGFKRLRYAFFELVIGFLISLLCLVILEIQIFLNIFVKILKS